MNSLLLILSKLRYFAPAWVFASLNIMAGTWVLYIPHVKRKLGIDDGQLGIALFCFSFGALLMIPLASKITRLIGLGRTTLIGIVIFSLTFLLPLLAPTYVLLCVTLFFTGLMVSLTDIAMNALVSEIEKEDQVHFMSASHGFFSLGGVLGAGIGSLVISYFEVPVVHMAYAALGVILTNVVVAKAYLSIRGGERKETEATGFSIRLLKPLLGLTIIAFLIMGSEGAIEHWSKLYLQDIVKVTSEEIAGFGFVAFSATMTLGRVFGDYVCKRFGSLPIIICGCLIGILGFGAVLSENLVGAIAGFAFVGLGFSVIIPELFRLAGQAKGVSSAEGISFVAGFGYIGFLASPALLGFLADYGTLRLSFIALLLAALLAMLISLFQRRRIQVT